MFFLKDVIDRHEKDCKAVAYSNDQVFSTSRDHTAFVGQIFKGDAFLNSVYSVGTTTFVGSHTGTLFKFSDNQKLEYPIHNGNITCITSYKFYVVTGGWDNTVRLTNQNDFNDSSHVNLPHAVWALLVVDDFIFAGCADNNIYKLDAKLQVLATIKAHTAPVRALCKYNKNFASCSNDASIKIWNLNGELQQEWFGHTAFVYSICNLKLDEEYILSVGEDNCCKVWHNGNIVQNIPIPETSLWCVASHGNAFAVASSSGKIYEFTNQQELKASGFVLEQFNSHLEQFAISKETIGDLNVDAIPDASVLNKPGPKEGHVQMVKEDNKIIAYSWSSSKWVKIGEVVNAIGNSRKQLYEGKEYDYVFDVDFNEKMMKLPVNANDNPYSAALAFMNKNGVSETHLDDIANFIIKNTGSAGSIQPAAAQANDPFTGNNRYIPSTAPTQGGGLVKSKPTFDYSKHVKDFFVFKSVAIEKVGAKLLEFNELYPTKHDIQALFTYDASTLGIFKQLLEAWGPEHKFPVLDAFRIFILSTADTQIIEYVTSEEFLKNADVMDDRNLLMVLRGYCNLFEFHESWISEHLNQFIINIAQLVPDKLKPTQVFVTLVLNICILMVKLNVGKSVHCRNLFQVLAQCMHHKDDEIGYRGLLSAKLLVF